MNDAGETWPAETPRDAIDMRAAAFVESRDLASWTPEHEGELEAWLSESSAHRVAYIRLNASWRRTARLAALRHAENPIRATYHRADWKHRLKVAGFLSLLIAMTGAGAAYLLMPGYDTYATTVGGRETLTLHDGSRIELNTNTVVRVLRDRSQRLVQLDRGEAFFGVRHDAQHPFVVVAAGNRLVDLGTKFSVRADGAGLQVTLVEGSIRFEPKGGAPQDQRTLAPGEVLLATEGGVSVKKQPMPSLATALAWRRGMLVFHETSLLEAASEFNRYNETKIVIEDSRAGQERINGTLPANDLEEFARMARNIFGLQTKKRGSEIVFAR